MKRSGILLFGFLCWVVGYPPVGSNYQQKDPAVPSCFGSLGGVTTGSPVGNEILT